VEEKATQRGASADATWSVEKEGVRGRGLPQGEGGNDVVVFPNHFLLLPRQGERSQKSSLCGGRRLALGRPVLPAGEERDGEAML